MAKRGIGIVSPITPISILLNCFLPAFERPTDRSKKASTKRPTSHPIVPAVIMSKKSATTQRRRSMAKNIVPILAGVSG